jgi:hypothetical protein
LRKAIKEYEVEDWVKAVCPLCKKQSDDSTKYAPQQLFEALDSQKSKKLKRRSYNDRSS